MRGRCLAVQRLRDAERDPTDDRRDQHADHEAAPGKRSAQHAIERNLKDEHRDVKGDKRNQQALSCLIIHRDTGISPSAAIRGCGQGDYCSISSLTRCTKCSDLPALERSAAFFSACLRWVNS